MPIITVLPSATQGYQYSSGFQDVPIFLNQGAPATATVSATLTAAQLQTGILSVNQGAGAATTLTLPTGTLMDAAFPNMPANNAFDFSVINVSTVGAEDATIAAGVGFTVVGNVTVASNAAVTDVSFARFRARKTDVATWILYRIG